MRPFRFVPFLVIGVSAGLLAAALCGRAGRPILAIPPPPPPAGRIDLRQREADTSARQAVESALAQLAEPRREWLQAGVWLRSRVPGLSYEGQGVYLKAPGGRYRLEARTRRERAPQAMFLAVSDGLQRWQATRTGSGRFRDVRRQRADDAAPAGQLVAGLDVLLKSLQAHLVWVRREVKQADVVVTGVWHPDLRRSLAPPQRPWPANLPRGCRLALRDGWPARVEWWGPVEESGEDRLLIELEFRDPVWDRPLTDEECDRLFAFDPAGAAVLDLSAPGKASAKPE